MSDLSINVKDVLQYFVPKRKILNFDNFKLGGSLGEGGYGKVYAATYVRDGIEVPVALKFFGYTKYKPNLDTIWKEIILMLRLDDGTMIKYTYEVVFCKSLSLRCCVIWLFIMS